MTTEPQHAEPQISSETNRRIGEFRSLEARVAKETDTVNLMHAQVMTSVALAHLRGADGLVDYSLLDNPATRDQVVEAMINSYTIAAKEMARTKTIII